MEIKRRLNAVAKRFGTEVEHLNIKHEILNICKRLEELADYAEAKYARMKAREESGERLFSKQDAAAKARQEEIAAYHAAEAEEALADQQQAKAEIDPRKVEEDAG